MRAIYQRAKFRSLALLQLIALLSACVTFDETATRPKVPSLCPSGMVYVHAPSKAVELCVDRYELTQSRRPAAWAMPLANQNYFDCQSRCAAQGKRLLAHREWLTACEGTVDTYCNKFRPHPVVRKMKGAGPWSFQNRNCKNEVAAWGRCMGDPTLNELPNSLGRNGEFPRCVSRYGVYHMIGNLGEWVQDIRWRRGIKLGRFNGGLYPQPKSSCTYTTIAHGPGYKDYSIGCRCGKDISPAARDAFRQALIEQKQHAKGEGAVAAEAAPDA